MIQIIIADDHDDVREGLKNILAETEDINVCDEACDGSELLEKVRRNKYDMVVSDISMPGAKIFDVIRQIKSEKPVMPILILSLHPQQYAAWAIKYGASGYLTKEKAPIELADTIRRLSIRNHMNVI